MAKNSDELERLIIMANKVLEGLCREDSPDHGKIQSIKKELDALLYQYYKSYTLTA